MAVKHREDSIKEINKNSIPNAIDVLGQELAIEKLRGTQKDIIIDSFGQKVTQLTLDIMQLKGGAE